MAAAAMHHVHHHRPSIGSKHTDDLRIGERVDTAASETGMFRPGFEAIPSGNELIVPPTPARGGIPLINGFTYTMAPDEIANPRTTELIRLHALQDPKHLAAVAASQHDFGNSMEGKGSRHIVDKLSSQAGPVAVPWLFMRPTSSVRIFWDLSIVFLLLYIAVVVPFALGFSYEAKGSHAVIELVVDLWFIADVLVNFRTGYTDEMGREVLDQRKAASHYFHSWFTLDFVSSIPYSLVFKALSSMNGVKLLKLARVLKALKVVRLTKMTKMLKIATLVEDLEEATQNKIAAICIEFSKFLFPFSFMLHWISCGWYGVANMSDEESWVITYGMEDAGLSEKYLAALYWTLTTMTTVGYGDITPQRDAERLYCIFGMVIGGVVYAYMVAMIVHVVEANDADEASEIEKMAVIKAFMRMRKFPKTLRRKIRRFYKAYFEDRSGTDEAEILAELPGNLRLDVAIFLLNEFVIDGPIFLDVPLDQMLALCKRMVATIAPPGQFFLCRGDASDSLYTLISGEAIVYNKMGRVTKRLLAGAVFGADTCFGFDAVMLASVRASTTCEAYRLNHDDMLSIDKQMYDGIRQMYDELFRNNHPPDALTGAASGKVSPAGGGGATEEVRLPGDSTNV